MMPLTLRLRCVPLPGLGEGLRVRVDMVNGLPLRRASLGEGGVRVDLVNGLPGFTGQELGQLHVNVHARKVRSLHPQWFLRERQ